MNETTAALALLLGVLIVAALSSRRVAVAASLLAFASFNFFFLPPVGTFAIAKRDDLVALFALLAVALIGSHLSQQARLRAQEAVTLAQQRNEAEMARRSAEARSALVASLSHDLKTPLTALTVAAGNLSIAQLSDFDRGEQLQILEEELRRLSRLFDHVIDLASVEAEAMLPEREWVLPAEVIEAARHHASRPLTGWGIRVIDDTQTQLVQLDPRMTSAALAHVLENAATYAPKDSPIEVRVRLSASRMVLEVRDHGPGVPHADLDRIFERGYRGDAAKRSSFGGGMGLAIARGLLAIQGGRISALNHPDGGAVITLDIPVAVRTGAEVPSEA